MTHNQREHSTLSSVGWMQIGEYFVSKGPARGQKLCMGAIATRELWSKEAKL